MLNLAEHILTFDKDIDSLKLQYVMFLSTGKYLDESGDLNLESINLNIDNKFELWDTGPVNRIVVESFSEELAPVYKESFSLLDKGIVHFLEKDEFLLVDSFHKTDVWKKNSDKINSRDEKVYLSKLEILESYLEMKIMYFS